VIFGLGDTGSISAGFGLALGRTPHLAGINRIVPAYNAAIAGISFLPRITFSTDIVIWPGRRIRPV